MANPEFGCAGPGANTAEQAFWVFSTNACGIYGDNDMTLVSGIGGDKTRTDRIQVAKEDHREGRKWLATAGELDRATFLSRYIRNVPNLR